MIDVLYYGGFVALLCLVVWRIVVNEIKIYYKKQAMAKEEAREKMARSIAKSYPNYPPPPGYYGDQWRNG